MLKLVINADDFGMNEGCSRGIVRAMTEGIVSDTTLMAGMPFAERAAQLIKAQGINRIGLHLTLTCGKPVLPAAEVPSLVDENGNFYRRVPLLLEHAKAEDVEKEYKAQIDRFFSYGLEMTHIDSHHHSHFHSFNLNLAIRYARELDVPMRQRAVIDGRDTRQAVIAAGLKTTDVFTEGFMEKTSSIAQLQQLISSYLEDGKTKSLEIMCHPGYVDPELLAMSSYNCWRANELATLTSAEMRRFIRKNDIQLVNFDRI